MEKLGKNAFVRTTSSLPRNDDDRERLAKEARAFLGERMTTVHRKARAAATA